LPSLVKRSGWHCSLSQRFDVIVSACPPGAKPASFNRRGAAGNDPTRSENSRQAIHVARAQLPRPWLQDVSWSACFVGGASECRSAIQAVLTRGSMGTTPAAWKRDNVYYVYSRKHHTKPPVAVSEHAELANPTG